MKMNAKDVAKELRALADSIEQGDSFEGAITYTCMEEGLGPNEFAVTGGYRIGNSDGQGGYRQLG